MITASTPLRAAAWIKWHLGPLAAVGCIDDMHNEFAIAERKGPVYLLAEPR